MYIIYILAVYFMSTVRKSARCYCRAFISILINGRWINYKYIIATNSFMCFMCFVFHVITIFYSLKIMIKHMKLLVAIIYLLFTCLPFIYIRVQIKGLWFVHYRSISLSHEPKICKTSIFHELFFPKYSFKIISTDNICLSFCLELNE